MPRIAAQQIIGENVGCIGVSIHDRKPRTAGTLHVFGPGFGTELVPGVWFYHDELKDSRIGWILPIECDGERSCSDRKSTRLNSSHLGISYAVFCLKKKK